MSRESLIKRFYQFRENSKIVENVWNCDILSRMSHQIAAYKTELELTNNLALGPEFDNIINAPKLLRELLESDFDYILKYNPELEYLRGKVFFTECDEKIDAVSVITAHNDEYLIIFNKNIIELIHYFFGFIHLSFQKGYYIDEFINEAQKDSYSEECLTHTLLKKISHLYTGEFEDVELDITFYFEPFDYIEQVIAARRFMLAHELSHIYCKHHAETNHGERFDYEKYSRCQEYEADGNGVYFLLNRFFNQMPLPIKFEEYCSLENHIRGIPQLLLLFDFVEGFHEWFKYKPQHPRAFMREIGSIETLYQHIVDLLGNNWPLKYHLQIVTLENQIIKRLPLNVIFGSIKGYEGILLGKNSFKLRHLSGLKLHGKAKELEIFLEKYEPYNIERIKNLEDF